MNVNDIVINCPDMSNISFRAHATAINAHKT